MCSLESIYAWRERMMGNLAFDILVEAPAVTNVSDLMSVVEAERLVESARLLRDARATWSEDATCCMTETAREALDIATRNLRLAEDARRSVARVARSLAALDGASLAGVDHVAEALSLAPRG